MRENIKMVESLNNELVPLNIVRHQTNDDKLKFNNSGIILHYEQMDLIIGIYKLKRCSNNECCKQCRYVKFKGTMTKWPVQKLAHRTTQKFVQYHNATDM